MPACVSGHRRLTDDGWAARVKTIIPTYGTDLKVDAQASHDIREHTARALNLEFL